MKNQDFVIPEVLDRLASKARGYITTDPNASMVKQCMMLEYLCRDDLDEKGLMAMVSVSDRNLGKADAERHARGPVCGRGHP